VKNFIYLLLLILAPSGTVYAQVRLVSKSSFARIYNNDFNALVGQEGQPINQVIIGINKPKIEISQIFKAYTRQGMQIPILQLNPYFAGKLNSDGNLDIFKADKINSELNYGCRLIINPLGFPWPNTPTLYYFDSKQKVRLQTQRAAIKSVLQELFDLSTKIVALVGLPILTPQKKLELQELQDKHTEFTAIFASLKKNKTYDEDKLYEVEKDAIWNEKHYLLLSFDFNRGVKSANYFQNNVFTDELLNNYTKFGTPAFNYTWVNMKKKFTFNAFLSFEVLKTNKIFDSKQKEYFTVKEVSTNNTLKVYDVKETAFDLTDGETKLETVEKGIIKFGATFLSDKLKNSGLNVVAERNYTDNLWNLKIALVLPNIKKESGKTSQANFRLVFDVKDILNQTTSNETNNPNLRQKAIVYVQLGIPINLVGKQ
jgi:hypothetical protein